MKAVVVQVTGGPEKLILEDVKEPSPGRGEVLVNVEAAGLNFIDTYHRSGLYPQNLPFTPGLEGAGTIAAVGEGVTELKTGDRIGWAGVLGTYAERHLIPADKAIPIPDGLETDTVAAVLLQGITAHYLATDTYPLKEGDNCLIHAGSGGVGLLLTQIAKLKGAYVITTVGSEDKAVLSKAAGADEVILYRETSFKDAVEEKLGANALHVVYDGVGAATFHDGLDLLRPRGMMVTFGNASGPVPEISPLLLAEKGSLFLTRPTMAHYIQSREELLSRTADLFNWISKSQLNVRIGAEFSLDQAADAHRALESRQTSGKVLIRP
ncbi:MAG: quinone oxidoreductase [Pseudomonadales bacterium]